MRRRENEPDAFGSLRIRDRYEISEPFEQRGKGQLVGRARRNTFGESLGTIRCPRAASVPRVVLSRRARRLDTVYLESRRDLFSDC